MRCLAVCQDELVIRMLDEILMPGFDVEFIVDSRPLARRLHDAGISLTVRRPAAHGHLSQSRRRPRHLRHHRGQRPAQPEERARGGPRRRRHARLRPRRRRRDPRPSARTSCGLEFPEVAYLSMSELFGGPLLTEFSRSLTRARVQQYQRYLQRRRPRADPAAQRSGPRRHGQRPGAAQRPAPDQDDGDHRRAARASPGRRTCGWSTCSISRSTPSRRESLQDSTASRWSTCSRTTSAD